MKKVLYILAATLTLAAVAQVAYAALVGSQTTVKIQLDRDPPGGG